MGETVCYENLNQEENQDILDSSGLQDCAHASGGDDAGTRGCGLQQNPAGAKTTNNLEGNRVVQHRDRQLVRTGRFAAFADGIGNFAGGAFPLANVNLVVGVVTAAGRLSLAIEHVENNIDNETMEKIKETALGYLIR